ncbi:MAG: hypothetical protein QXI16_04090 [Sulfolobaceae archaeon]
MDTLFNWITSSLDYVLSFVLAMLPDSPFQIITRNNTVIEYLGYVNYFIPMTEILGILQLWITAVGVYYVYQAILRFAKVVE